MTAEPVKSTSRDSHLAEIIAAYLQAVDNGQLPDRDELLARHPELATELTEFFTDHDQFGRVMSPFRGAVPSTQFFGSSRTSESNPEVPVGHHFGEYELIEEIARGGMGVVFKARNARLDRTVAIKMILAGHLATPAEVDRFRREAKSAAQLDHPNIVPLYEVGEHDGQHYFAMKLIDGGSLADDLTRFADNPKAAVELLRTVARAVHYAHQRGILHRDLKPANILIDRAGQPHVTDFGLAKRLVGESEYPSSSAIVGTPSYMAPEQVSGNNALSTAIDVYSLGAIFYELLTGRSPFRAETPFDTLLQVVQKDPEPPRAINPRIDRDLETICLKCLAKDPDGRYGSAEALADDFDHWLLGCRGWCSGNRRVHGDAHVQEHRNHGSEARDGEGPRETQGGSARAGDCAGCCEADIVLPDDRPGRTGSDGQQRAPRRPAPGRLPGRIQALGVGCSETALSRHSGVDAACL
jgi:eukaryotic-like serine/threonine-protein kinase